MAVRNFWVEANIDGRSTKVAGGPVAKDGGMNLKLYQRDDNDIVTAFDIRCTECDGKLKTQVVDYEGIVVADFITIR